MNNEEVKQEVVTLYAGNRLDRAYRVTLEEIAEGYLTSEHALAFRTAGHGDRQVSILHFLTRPQPEGWYSVPAMNPARKEEGLGHGTERMERLVALVEAMEGEEIVME